MDNTNSNIYLIYYLIIILVLLFTINYISLAGCKIPSTINNKKENFNVENIISEFIIIGVGTDKNLYMKDGLASSWINIPSSCCVIDITSTSDGKILGIGTDNKIWVKNNIHENWISVGNNTCCIIGIGMMNDGTILGVDVDNYLYTMASSLQGGWNYLGKNSCCITKAIQLTDGRIIGIGMDNKLYIKQTLKANWIFAGDNSCCIKSIAEAPTGILIGVGMDNKLYTKQNLNTPWIFAGENTCCVTSICTLKINPTIDDFIKKGCFIDQANRAIPNLLANTNTIKECVNLAKSKGYNTIGYQYHGQCWAGNDSDFAKYGKQTNTTACNELDPGASTNIVYQQNLPPKPRYCNKFANVHLPGGGFEAGSSIDNIKPSPVATSTATVQSCEDECLKDSSCKQYVREKNGNCYLMNTAYMYDIDNKNQNSNQYDSGSCGITTNIPRVHMSTNNVKPVYALGKFGIVPWGNAAKFDSEAYWIWNSPAADKSAIINSFPIKFQKICINPTNDKIPIEVSVIAANAIQGANMFNLNQKLISTFKDAGWLGPDSYSKISTNLEPGTNLFEFVCQNNSNSAGLIVSVRNKLNGQIILRTNNTWLHVLNAIEIQSNDKNLNLKAIQSNNIINQIIQFKNQDDVKNILVGGTFKLRINLPNVPSYVKGQEYKEGQSPNYFYISVEKLAPNCSIEHNSQCMNIFVDNKKCKNLTLSNESRINSYRLVLVSSQYALDPTVPFGKNTDFTIIMLNDKLYIKNVQTGYLPKLFVNDFKQNIYGYMDSNYLSNINTLKDTNNRLCGINASNESETLLRQKSTGVVGNVIDNIIGSTNQNKKDQKFISCSTNNDGSMYLITTNNLAESTPIQFVLNKDGTINLRLQQYNIYGNIDKSYSLVFCNFNVNNYAFIEKTTNPLGTFLLNMVCFDPDDKRQLPKNTLNFEIELIQYPSAYINKNSIIDLDK